MKKYNIIKDWTNDRLRRMCNGLSPDLRIIVIVTFCTVFGVMSVYMTVSSIYSIGKRDAELMQIEHIKTLELKQSKDSILIFKNEQYGK
ncbi:conjugal transfer protein [Bacteroidia bacterium]|nr:conjugal transfer protein [Bacteroidia bacterium]